MWVLAALCQPHCIHEIPPSLSCSRLSPSAHSSKLQNGTNPMWSNAFLVSVFSFKGQKGKGTRCDIYEPVKLAALTRKCSQVSFLGGEGTEQAPGKGSRLRGGWASSSRCLPICNGHSGIMQSPPTPPAWPQRWQVANGGGFLSRKSLGTHQVPLQPCFQPWHPSSFLQGRRRWVWILSWQLLFPTSPEDKCTVKRFLFAFFLNITCHIYLRKHEQGTVLHAPVGRLGCISLLGKYMCPLYKPTHLNLFKSGENTVCFFLSAR